LVPDWSIEGEEMLKEVLMGKIGLTMESGTIVGWLKDEDEYVEMGDPLFEVETDKATQVIESFHSGYLKKIVVRAGQEVPVRTVIAYIGEKDDTLRETPAPKDESAGTTGVSAKRVPAPERQGQPRTNASPLAKRLAADLGIDLSLVRGTGPEGRIGKDDVIAAKDLIGKEGAPGGVPGELSAERFPSQMKVASKEKLSGIRKVVAERMTASFSEAPHIHLELYADMTAASRLRERMNKDESPSGHLTYSDILIWASARTIRKHLHINATFRDGTIITFDEINIGLAVAMERGLVVPVVRNADSLTLADITRSRAELVERTKAGKQTPDDLTGGTFTITNLGMFGIVSFKPILNTGQAATLAVGQIAKTPVVEDDGSVQVRPIANLSLALDHR
jgi:pyruvate dehydrogenase E2 component (dihydrolipoamide acetyltransferase)